MEANYCPSCGSRRESSGPFCSGCGVRLGDSATALGPTAVLPAEQEVERPAAPVVGGPRRSSLARGLPEPAYSYYAEQFARISKSGGADKGAFNWAAALGGNLWAVYRGLWSLFWIQNAAAIIGSLLLPASGIGLIVLVGIFWYSGARANFMLYELAQRRGGVENGRGLLWVLAVLAGIALLVAFVSAFGSM